MPIFPGAPGFLTLIQGHVHFSMKQSGSLDFDPGSQGNPMNSWYVSFETECTSVCLAMRVISYRPTQDLKKITPVMSEMWGVTSGMYDMALALSVEDLGEAV